MEEKTGVLGIVIYTLIMDINGYFETMTWQT